MVTKLVRVTAVVNKVVVMEGMMEVRDGASGREEEEASVSDVVQ
jgi:hypothetical protein